MNLKKNNKILNHCILYMFKTILKTLRTYIYILIIPIIFLTLVYFLTYPAIVKNSRYIVISSYILLPIIFSGFLISYLICEWRDSVFIKQLNNFGINKFKFILSLLIVIFTIVCGEEVIITSYLFVIDSFKKINIMQIWISQMKTFSQWFGLFFSILLNILLVFFLTLLIAGSLKNAYISQALNLTIFLLSLLFGDFFIDITYSISTPTIIISYFVPQKYITWINYIFYSQSEKYYYNFFQIVPLVDYKLSFTSLYQPLFCSIVLIGISAGSSYFSFLHGTKR